MSLSIDDLRRTLGNLDVYLLDQVLKGRVQPGMRLLDAGCGGGRNVAYLMGAGVEVHGVDRGTGAIEAMRSTAAERAPGTPGDRFVEAALEALPYADHDFDVVLAIAVLHFARDDDHFDAMLTELWRVLRPGGMLFARLTSSIGLDPAVVPATGRASLPDGSERYLVDAALLRERTERLGGALLEPIKSVNVEGLRSMTTWVVAKS